MSADLIERLFAWGQNSPDPDYFQGDILSSVLSDCALAADALAAKDTALSEMRAELEASQRKAQAYLNSANFATDDVARIESILASTQAEILRLAKELAIANAQLADMEFLSVEGFISWKTGRAARSLSQDGEEGA